MVLINGLYYSKEDVAILRQIIREKPLAMNLQNPKPEEERLDQLVQSHSDTDTFIGKLTDAKLVAFSHFTHQGQYRSWAFKYEPANIEAILYEYDNQNQIQRLREWFMSRKWSIVVYCIVWGVTILGAWVYAIKQLLEWFGVYQ